MVLFPSLVNGKVANGGRENDRVFSSFSSVVCTAKKPSRSLDRFVTVAPDRPTGTLAALTGWTTTGNTPSPTACRAELGATT